MEAGFVGARKVNGCKCIFCRECLIEGEILFRPESQITLKQAIEDEIKCSRCKALLYTQEERNSFIQAESQ